MLGWALIFAVLSVLTGYFGFIGLVGFAAGVAQALFVGFLILTVASFVSPLFQRSAT